MNEESLFHRALELPAAERAAFLDAACAGDVGLRQRLEALLQAHAQPGSFLQERAVTLPAETPSAASPPAEAAGMRIGPYKLIEPIGEGGMGSVWMAEQLEPVRRLVALKLIKEGLDSARVIARFEAERQALALMDHPNIAKVFDAGMTTTGRPYFVMELVKGVSITKYCDERRLTPRERLELCIPVCQAVQHAHQKGIIHRDLKPSNVLIALYDGRPVPKVIDFGIAKATTQQLTERTLHTGFGAIVGTLEYMSPEQAEPNQLDIDTRSDVYSLGVLLYELLTGTTPLDRKQLQDAAIWELLRLIREEEPPNPSTRLSSSGTLPALSAQRHMEPAKLARLMRGELDWIVMKALEKDRQRRYETANALADDLSRYLRDEPVQAGPPSPTYRLRKFVQRNRGTVLAASLLLLTLLIGIAGTSWGLLEAQTKRDDALDARNEAVQARDDEARQRAAAVQAERAEKLRASELALALEKTATAEKAEHARAGELKTALADAELNLANSKILLAQSAWNGPDGAVLANVYLDAIPERSRNWEWRYLKRQYEGGLFTLYGHDEVVTCVAWSHDGSRLVSGSADHTLRLWDTRTGALLQILKSSLPYVRSVAWSGDDRYIASAASDATIRIWDARTGQTLHELQGHAKAVTSVAWSSDSRRLVSTSTDQTLRIWDARAGQLQHTLKGHTYSIDCVAWSPDGSKILSCGTDETGVCIWDAQTGQRLHQLKGHRAWVKSAAWSPDGKHLVSGGYIDHAVHIWDANTGQSLHELKGHREAVTAVAWSGDGQRVASASNDGMVRLWDPQTGQLLHELKGHNAWGDMRLLWSSDGTRLASSGGDHTVRIWDARSGELLHTLRGHTHELRSMAWRGDGQLLATAGDKTVRLWDTRTGTASPVFKGRGAWNEPFAWANFALSAAGDRIVNQLDGGTAWTLLPHHGRLLLYLEGKAPLSGSYSRDGTRAASPGPAPSGTVHIWDAHSRKLLHELKGHQAPVLALAWSEDGKHLASAGYIDMEVRLWQAETGQLVHVLKHVTSSHSVAFSRDGRLLASSGAPLPVWDVRTGKLAQTLRNNAGIIECMAFNSDGSLLAAGSHDTIQVWNVHTGERLYATTAKLTRVRSLAWSADDSRLVSGSAKLVRIWDARTGLALLDLPGHENDVTSVAFSADGTQVHSGDGEVVRIWDARPGASERRLQGHEGPVRRIAWSHDGRRIVGNSGKISLWDARTGRLLRQLPGASAIDVAWSHDDRYIACGGSGGSGSVRIHDAETGRMLHELKAFKDSVYSIAWNGADQRLAGGGRDMVVCIWDAQTGQILHHLRGHDDFIIRVAWSRDGKYVVAADRLGRAIVWDATTGARQPAHLLPPLREVTNTAPDGQRTVVLKEHEALLVDLHPGEAERQRRLWLTRPDPEWHVAQHIKLRKAKNAYVVAVHESWEQHARGVLAFERCEFDQALAHFLAAAALRPALTPGARPAADRP